MSLLPFFIDDFRPSKILDQHFGVGLHADDLLSSFCPRGIIVKSPVGYIRPWATANSPRDTGSTITCDKDKFQVNLDVQHFSPEEIKVKINDDVVTVEGEHEEKRDEHGFVSRKFVRKYVVPEGHDVDKVESRLSSDGVLTITAPKLGETKEGTRTVPIQQTGVPSKAVEGARKEGDDNVDTK